MEKISWRQKSRITWLREGDKNTKFFHRVANARRRVNTIFRLEVEGVVLEEEEAIRLAVEKFYKELYVEPHSFRPTLDGVSFESTPTEMCDWLERPFEEEGVFKALGEMCGDKAPGPDGFTIAFYKKCWGGGGQG